MPTFQMVVDVSLLSPKSLWVLLLLTTSFVFGTFPCHQICTPLKVDFFFWLNKFIYMGSNKTHRHLIHNIEERERGFPKKLHVPKLQQLHVWIVFTKICKFTHVLCFTGFDNKPQFGTRLVLMYPCHVPDTCARDFGVKVSSSFLDWQLLLRSVWLPGEVWFNLSKETGDCQVLAPRPLKVLSGLLPSQPPASRTQQLRNYSVLFFWIRC